MSDLSTATVARLVRRARDPALPLHLQDAAFTGLVARSQHLAFKLALTTLRDWDEAKDVVQDAFLTVWLRLRQLRSPDAFSAWLRRIVASECRRRLRRQRRESTTPELPESAAAPEASRDEPHIEAAFAGLPEGERQVAELFYYIGYSQRDIGRLLGLKEGTVGKRLYSARLRIRRGLPPATRRRFVPLAPSRRFLQQVRAGIFDEYVGEYRFERRPDLTVSITREGDRLVSRAAGQCNLLASLGSDSMATSHYDGEGRFRRNRQGRVTHFVYYEFGRRLGVARRVAG